MTDDEITQIFKPLSLSESLRFEVAHGKFIPHRRL